MTETPPQDHSGILWSIAGLFATAGAFLLRKLGKQPRPECPKGLSVADFQRIVQHVDARSDARLAEALRPLRDQLDSMITSLSDMGDDVIAIRMERRHDSTRMSGIETANRILQERISASGGD